MEKNWIETLETIGLPTSYPRFVFLDISASSILIETLFSDKIYFNDLISILVYCVTLFVILITDSFHSLALTGLSFNTFVMAQLAFFTPQRYCTVMQRYPTTILDS